MDTMSQNTQGNDESARSPQRDRGASAKAETRNADPGTQASSASVPQTLVALLDRHGVTPSRVDPRTVCFSAVPVSRDYSKPRTNLLLQRTAPNGGSTAYVDTDLAYAGGDAALMRLLTGPAHRDWRRLRIPPVPGTLADALCAVLELLGSPIAAEARAAAAEAGLAAHVTGAELEIGPVLAALGELVAPALAAETYRASLRKDLALRLATLATSPAHPHAAVLWAPAGAGRDHLMLAAAHLLLDAKRVSRVVRVSGGLVAAGCIFQAEVDSALLRLLTEAAALGPECLLLVQDLDVCVSGSPVSLSLACGALDRGLKLLATARSEAALGRLARDEALARRLLAVPVEPLDREGTGDALVHLARASGMEADPTVVQATLNLAAKRGGAEPAASLGLLGSAIADAAWRGGREIHPDDIFAAPRGEWPEAPQDPGKE